MSKLGKVIYRYINHKIHYFRKTETGDFALDELIPLSEAVKEPLLNNFKDDEPNYQNIEIQGSNDKIRLKPNENTKNPNNEIIRTDNPNYYRSGSLIENKKYDLVIAIAMYAEELERIESTLEGISANLPALVKSDISVEKILILIISDGREKVNNEVFDTFTEKKLDKAKEEQIDRHMKTEIFSSSEIVHYDYKKPNYLISCLVKREKLFDFCNKKIEMDILFSIKKENRGKLDSHYWLFAGFCQHINPEYIILLDTGTIPDLVGGLALSSLILPMKNNPFIAGTCGEIELDNNYNCCNPTLCAQILEYKYTHVVDKYFESLFGFISVLPGAFSAYRWKALNQSSTLSEYFALDHSSKLSEYFKDIDNDKADCDTANRYLAEDRIFCWVLFAMKQQANILHFIPDAKAKTDAPEFFGEFMLQRRRWINGSNFALYYVLGNYHEMFQTKHRMRHFFFLLLYVYYIIQTILGYFTLGTYYFVFDIICQKNFKKDSVASRLTMSSFLLIIITMIITSLTVKPTRVVSTNKISKTEEIEFKRSTMYIILSCLLGLYNLFIFILGVYTIFNGGMNNPHKAKFRTLNEFYQEYKEYWGALILAFISLGNFLLPLIYQPTMIPVWITNFVQYLVFQPTYAIILNVFAVCNIDDVSWGNRDSKAHISDSIFKKYKLKFLASWLVLNFMVGWCFSYVITNQQSIIFGNDKKLINFYSILVAVLTAFKLLGAMLGKFKFYVIDKLFLKIMNNRNNENDHNTINRVMQTDGWIPVSNELEDNYVGFHTEKAVTFRNHEGGLEGVGNFTDNKINML